MPGVVDAAGPADALAPDAAVDPRAIDVRVAPIYLVMTDRFANGDPANDELGNPGCFDPEGDRSFHGGDLAGLTARAGYLDELGVGTVWSTPFYEQVGCGYHGYWADYRDPDPRALEPRFGTDDDLDTLLAELHGRGMRLFLDMIANHAGRGATITEQRPSWFHTEPDCRELGPPEIYCPLSGLPDFRHEDPVVAEYVTEVSAAWLARFDVDGVRMDTAKHVPLDYFADAWLPRARAERPGLFVIAEVFDASGADVYRPYLDAGFDSAFHFAVRGALIDVFGKDVSTNALADRVAASIDDLGLERALHMTLFLANHDVPRWTDEATAAGSPSDLLARYRLALAALFTLPGIPQLYAGDELGLTGAWPDNRRDMPAWAWTAATRAGDHPESLPDAAGTFEHVRRLAAIRRAHPALWRGDYLELWRQNGGAPLYAFLRSHGDSRAVVVFHNGDAPAEVAIPIAGDGGLDPADREALGDGARLDEVLGAGPPAELTVADGALTVAMPPRSVGIYVVADN